MSVQLLEPERVKTGDNLIGNLALIRASILPNDFISAYIPFIANLLYDGDYSTVKIETIVNDFAVRYGFEIPRLPMTAILQKCTVKGMIRKAQGGYIVVKSELSAHKFSSDTKNEVVKYDTVVFRLQKYAEDNYDKIYDDITAQELLLAFLENNSARTITFKFSEFTEEERKSKQNMYIVSEFISAASKTDFGLFSLIKELAFVHMMASAITYGLGVEAQENEKKTSYNAKIKFKNLTLYLDTPFVLRLLGLDTDEMRMSCEDLMDGLKKDGISFKIFGHTYDEMLKIIEDCETWIENPSYEVKYASLALRNFIARNYKKADVSLFINDLPNKLATWSIEIDDIDYYHKFLHYKQMDETPIREHLIATYKQNDPNFDETKKAFTIECDVRSISHIMKLWPRKKCRSYYDVSFLFLTTNQTLSFAARKFTSEDNKSAMHNVFPCVTDVFLGTVVWLNSPIDAIENFSKKKLLADCMAAVSPSDELIKKLSDSIENLYESGEFNEHEYYLLKARVYQNDYLQKKTLNDENAFSDKITDEILEELKGALVAPLTEKIKNLEEKYDTAIEETQRLQLQIDEIAQREDLNKGQQKTKEHQYEEKAEKQLHFLANAFIPVVVGLVVFFVVLFTNMQGLSPWVSITLKIVSGLIAFLSTCIIAVLKTKNRLRSLFFKEMIRRTKVKDFKKTL